METEKKKEIKTSILRRVKFDDLDRAEAIIRLPEYQKDLKGYLKSDFSEKEFKNGLTVKKLCKAITADKLGNKLKSEKNTIKWLNELLKSPDLYEIIEKKKGFDKLEEYNRERIKKLIKKLKNNYETSKAEIDLKRLNRYLLQEFYPQKTPKHIRTYKQRKEFCKKYGLSRVLTPRVFEQSKNPKVTGFTPNGKFITHEMMQEHLPEKVMKRKRLLLNQLFIKKKKPFHVQIKVDLNRSIKENLFLVRKDIEALQQFIKKVEKAGKKELRKRELTYSPWLVYDMLKKGLNRSQIARELSGEIGNPSHNEILMSHYKDVERAENKAKQIIEHIKEEIKNNS